MLGKLRTIAALLTAMLMSAVMAVPAAADDTSGPHSGHFGPHALIDTTRYPGVTCVYPGKDPNGLGSIRVRAPIVYAYDRTSGPDGQPVGWRFRIQYADVGSPQESDWHSLGLSSIVTAQATEERNATWMTREFQITDHLAHPRYRALVTMQWYFPNLSNVDGKAIHRPEHYRYALGDGQTFEHVTPDCGATLG